MSGLLQDLRYALRQLRKSRGFSTVAVLTLALGIGANTAIFTVVNALLLKTLPVRDPQQLVIVGDPSKTNSRSLGTPRTDVLSYPLYKELRDHNSVFSGLAAAASDHFIEVDAGPGHISDLKVTGRLVSGNYFSLLGIESAAGRLFSDFDDIAESANPVVVLSYSYWQHKFSLSSSVIGKTIHLNGYPFTVVGVAPAGYYGDVVGEQMALYVPLSMQPQIVRGRHWLTSANASWLSLIGRMKPGITAARAEANLNTVFQQAVQGNYGASLSSDDRNAIREDQIKIRVSPGASGLSDLRDAYKTPLLLLMGIVGLVLLIACVNIANLLLARAAARNKEVAVRLAVGASFRRVLQQLLTESLLLAIIGGLAGSWLATWGVHLLVGLLGSDAALPLAPNARVLSFTFAVTLITGILFGLVPALQSLNVQVSPALKETSQTTAEKGHRLGLVKLLIASQVAISVLVLFSAGLLVRSLQKLMTQDFGYKRDHLLVARLDPSAAGYDKERVRPLAEQLAWRIASTPGIRAVTYSENGLFAGRENADSIIVPGFTAGANHDSSANEDFVGPGYFETVGIPVLAGRGIEVQDNDRSTRVAVVNEAMAKYFFAGQNPIGRQFRIDDADWLDKPITIVGISRDAKDHPRDIRQRVEPRFYMAYQQVPEPREIAIEAQVAGDPSAAVANAISQIKSVDSHLPVNFAQTLERRIRNSAANQFALAELSTFFAGLALLLACIGLYGVMSYTVAGRTREIGVRMALGARPTDILRLVLGEAMVLAAAGLAIGIPTSLASSRLLSSFLFGLRSTDPLSLTVVVLLLGMVAGFAGFIPARRAAKVDPMRALRYE